MRTMQALACVLLLSLTGCLERDGAKELVDEVFDRLAPKPTMVEIGSLSAFSHGLWPRQWGYWARDGQGDTLFAAALFGPVASLEGSESTAACAEGPYCLDLIINGTAIDGNYSLTNPVSGSAVWLGKARAVQGSTAYEGRSRLVADMFDATVDVSIAGIGRRLSWHDLPMTRGQFGNNDLINHVSGSFFGSDHEGAAGRFWVDNEDYIVGVFGALRQ